MSAPGQLQLEQAIRTRLLTFTPVDGSPTLATALGSRLYIDEAPDSITAPYAVLHLAQSATGDEGDSGFRREATLTLSLYGRNSAQRATLKLCADVAQQALWKWLDASTGAAFMTGSGTEWLPPDPNAADRELITAIVKATLYWYPDSLTQYAVS